MRRERTMRNCAAALAACLLPMFAGAIRRPRGGPSQTLSVGPQYDSTHVYVAPGALDAFVDSFVATFGGTPSKPLVTNVLARPGPRDLSVCHVARRHALGLRVSDPDPVSVRLGTHRLSRQGHG
jgi:hypothetical protein